MPHLISILGLLLSFSQCWGQENYTTLWVLQPLADSIRLEKLEFYCFEYSHNHISEHYIISFSEHSTQSITTHSQQLFFGVDSTLQRKGAQSGVLDPTKNLYWTWQTGYIHLKLEFSTQPRGTRYVFHIGGYQYPYNTVLPFPFQLQKKNELTVDLGPLLTLIREEKLQSIMSPGIQALSFARLFCSSIIISGHE